MDRDVKPRPPVLMAWGRWLLAKEYAFSRQAPKPPYWCVCGRGALLDDALYFSAQADEVLDEQWVAAIDVEHVVHLGVTVGDQAREHQARAGPDVGRPHRRAGQLRDPPHHRVVAIGAGV